MCEFEETNPIAHKTIRAIRIKFAFRFYPAQKILESYIQS